MTSFTLAIVFLAGMVWDGIESRYAAPLAAAIQTNLDSGTVVLSLASTPDAEISGRINRAETCGTPMLVELARFDSPVTEAELPPPSVVPQIPNDIFAAIRNASASAGASGVDLLSIARKKVLPRFAPAYRSVLRLATFMGLPRIQSEAALNHAMIMGTVSTYNPYRDGIAEGGTLTASGELYDPAAWTAAVQTDLREQFGGVRYGKLYQPKFVLIESGEKQAIVRINDVGRLKPGRVLDLNERSMRYFDPFLSRGLIEDVRITLLPGEDWAPGPVGGVQLISLASTTN
jgi:peptidoglycan lytic transglycosylase